MTTADVSLDPTDYLRALKQATEAAGEEKLQLLRSLRSRIQAFEMKAAMDFSVPFYTVSRIKDLIPEVDAAIKRLSTKKKA